MEYRKIGLYLGIFGTLLLFIAMIMGAIIGYNNKIIDEYWNGPLTAPSDTPENVKEAEISNSYYGDFNVGLSSFGIGIILIGIGFSIAQNSKENRSFFVVAVIGIIILSTSFFLSVYQASISEEEEELFYKDNRTDKDREREDKIDEIEAFLSPFNQFLGGFIYGSLGIALALLSIILSLFHVNKTKKKSEKEKITRISVEPLSEDEITHEC